MKMGTRKASTIATMPGNQAYFVIVIVRWYFLSFVSLANTIYTDCSIENGETTLPIPCDLTIESVPTKGNGTGVVDVDKLIRPYFFNDDSSKTRLFTWTTDDGNDENASCSLYLAPSTIPGAGMGIFAGDTIFEIGDIVSTGDAMVPLFDMAWNNDKEEFLNNEFLWGTFTYFCSYSISCQVASP
jgi:hypothetical protein